MSTLQDFFYSFAGVFLCHSRAPTRESFRNTLFPLLSLPDALFNVIRGLRPANLDHRVRLCVTPVDDYREELFNHPSPDTTVSTSPARGEVLKHLFRVIREHTLPLLSLPDLIRQSRSTGRSPWMTVERCIKRRIMRLIRINFLSDVYKEVHERKNP